VATVDLSFPSIPDVGYTRRPGTHVGIDEALRTCRDILEGRLDDIPAAAFYFAGGIGEIRKRAASGQ
jgi:F-type H+-transporting ATPase subunit beta